MNACELDLAVDPSDSACRYVKQLHYPILLFCWRNSPFKFNLEMTTNYFRQKKYVLSENPAVVVLFVHTQKLGHHYLIKILNDLQFKKTYGGR